jgi:hypothetical protein
MPMTKNDWFRINAERRAGLKLKDMPEKLNEHG